MANSISPDELAYTKKVKAEMQAAQTILGFWVRHLFEKYGLAPSDLIEDDGSITRVGPLQKDAQPKEK